MEPLFHHLFVKWDEFHLKTRWFPPLSRRWI